jgi:hypothetical protein
MECVPVVENEVESVAVPELRVAAPSDVVPSKNVTVPVAAEGETVAVSVTAAPSTGFAVEAARVIVVEVVEAFQKLPQPANRGAIPSSTAINNLPVPSFLVFIESPCPCVLRSKKRGQIALCAANSFGAIVFAANAFCPLSGIARSGDAF